MELVIVESPNKVKKIQGYLGPQFVVAATAGHFRDLPERELGVDVASMSPQYVVDDGKKGLVSRLRAQARTAISRPLMCRLPSTSMSEINRRISSFVGSNPSAVMATSSSFASIESEPSVSKRSNASLINCSCSAVRTSAAGA